ncbi:MAG: replication and repair protein RecN [Bacteroidetes bacterium]|jgi:DNA repair protein RecN (Recombination protein N)|nr:replication and repair protein RecN [Bacteroidota bacterium]
MLKQLNIKNYALINESTIDFPKGLTVITGETGAGKSILLGALGLVLGNRAETDALSDKSKKCIVEAVFDISNYHLQDFFKAQDIDFENETTVRREISPEGKSRAFINDSPATLSVLKELAERLIDVHSQHETLLLNQVSFQFSVLDAFAGLKTALPEYKTAYSEYQSYKKKLQELQDKEVQLKKDLDYFKFQFGEIEELSPKENEYTDLEKESEALENAESIKGNLNAIYSAINGDHENVVSRLNALKSVATQLSKYGSEYEEIGKRISSSLVELKDLAEETAALEEKTNYNPERLVQVNDRIDAYNRLLKKHGAKTEHELIALKNEFEEKINTIENFDDELAKLQKQLQGLKEKLGKLAKSISDKRKKAVPGIETEIKKMLETLSMPNAQFKVEITERTEFNTNGLDDIRFLFSANKGGEFKELHKVASGGELSRLMLCIKALVAKLTALPAIIFDEIDTGVSGDVADKIGVILESMGTSMQVISITHLPQLASKGKSHLFVYKTDTKEKTVSHIKSLTEEERVIEIAKMLSTGKPTEAALSNAKELLK